MLAKRLGWSIIRGKIIIKGIKMSYQVEFENIPYKFQEP